MALSNTVVKNKYTGNGSTTVFPYTFALAASDGDNVGVYVTDGEGVSQKVPATNYTIDTDAQTVTYPKTGDPLPVGRKITIVREIPSKQELNLENLGPFYAEDIEGTLDRIVMMIQQHDEKLSRATLADISE